MKTSSIALSTILSVVFLLIACNKSDSFSSDSANSSGQGGSMARFTINGDFLYTVDHSTLKVFDVSTPGDPNHLSSRTEYVGTEIETIFTTDTLLYIGSQNGMYIYDISRPGLPNFLSVTFHVRSCDPIVTEGNYAYVTLNTQSTWCGNNSNQLRIYNVSNPLNPTFIRSINLTTPKGLGVDGNKLFVCTNGIRLYDITDPENPTWTGDLEMIPEARGVSMYDVIPLKEKKILLAVGENGLYQFDYSGETLAYVSKIEVKRN